MTCTEVNSYLDRVRHDPPAALPEAVRRHLEGCSPCRSIWDFFTKREEGDGGSREVRSRVEQQVLGSLHPVKPLPGTARLASGFLLVFVVIAALFVAVVGSRGAADMDALPFAVMLILMGAAVLLLSLTLSKEMVPGQRWVWGPRGAVVLLVSLFVAIAALFPWEVGDRFLPQNWKCFRMGLALSVPSAGLIVILLRRGVVLSLGVAGAMAGLLAGLVGMTVLHFGCNVHEAPHIALSHLGLPVVGTLLGYLMGHALPLLGDRFRSSSPNRR